MKSVCDHCSGPINKERDHNTAVWCGTCVKEDASLLNQALLTSDDGSIITVSKDGGEQYFGIRENVQKILAIPKKGVPVAINVPTDQIAMELKVEPVEEKIDFDKYNSTLPGRRGTY